jgi:hypothetical protein
VGGDTGEMQEKETMQRTTERVMPTHLIAEFVVVFVNDTVFVDNLLLRLGR